MNNDNSNFKELIILFFLALTIMSIINTLILIQIIRP